ncbi:MAG: hypothetical protein WC523_04720 [Patescibacteria group bacterium]
MKTVKYVDKYGTIIYCLNDLLHREDGPAREWTNDYKAWYLNGKRDREDGPAVEYSDGDKAWFIKGVEYTEEEFKEYKLIEKLSGLK